MIKKNAWKTAIDNAKKRSLPPIPPGWETRAQVAAKLGCAEDNVNNTLKLAFKDRSVLTNHFEVWDKIADKVVKAQFYRLNTKMDKKVPEPRDARASVSRQKWPFPEGTQVRRKDGGSGVVISGNRVQWDSGSITAPKGRTIEKIVAV